MNVKHEDVGVENETARDISGREPCGAPRPPTNSREPIDLKIVSMPSDDRHGADLPPRTCFRVPGPAIDIELAGLSLGGSVCDAHGTNRHADWKDKDIYVTQNFVAPRRFRSGDLIHIDPCPNDSKPLNLLAIPCVYPGERALVTTPQPGMIEYFVSRGIIESEDQVEALAPPYPRGAQPSLNFDPLALALREGRTFDGNPFVSAFSSDLTRHHAIKLGLKPVQLSDGFLANNKAEFHEAATRLGISTCEAIVVKSEGDIARVVTDFGTDKVWCKYSNGFGGDMLCSIPPMFDRNELRAAISRLKDTSKVAIVSNGFGLDTVNRIWPNSRILPESGSIVVEADVARIGTKLLEGSCVMQVRHDGLHRVDGYFQQLTDADGHFLGSTSLNPKTEFGASFFAQLEVELGKVAQHCRELQLFGIVGVDFMVVRTKEDTLVPVIIELNGRPPLSACSHIVGTQKLNAPHWMSVAVWAENPINDYYDLVKALAPIGGERPLFNTPEHGGIVPMILGSVGTMSPFGDYQTIHSRRWCNLILTGTSPEHCRQIMAQLERDCGFSSSPPSDGW